MEGWGRGGAMGGMGGAEAGLEIGNSAPGGLFHVAQVTRQGLFVLWK